MKKSADDTRKMVAENRRARHDYFISDRFEAGLVLQGTEVKAIRAGLAHINDAYVQVRQGEAFLIGGHIGEYSHGNQFNHEPDRTRKLLLNRREIAKIAERLATQGEAVVPLALYFRNGRAKIELGVGKGKDRGDKRDAIKDRETRREIDRAMRRR